MSYDGSEAVIGRGASFSIGSAVGSDPISITGNITSGSKAVASVSSIVGLSVGAPISGAGIPAGATIAAFSSGSITLSVNATATASTVALTVVSSFTSIGEITDINPSGRKWDTEEVTNFESSVDKEYIKAMRNPGPFSVKFNRVDDDTGQEALEDAFDATVAYIFRLQFPAAEGFTTGEIWVFNALVLAHDPDELTPAKVIMGSLEMQRTGAITITAAISS